MAYQVLSHAADAGIEATAESLPDLFDELLLATFELMSPNEAGTQADTTRTVEIRAETLEDLVVDTLSEFLFIAETEDQHFSWFRSEVDPEALVEPVRIIRNYVKTSGFEEGDPYVFIECVQTIFPVEGTATPVSPGTVIPYEVPDMYGRPWAQIWEKYWEQGMERPDDEDLFNFE